MADYEHMSWCKGKHDMAGECQLVHEVAEGQASAWMLGIPCSHATVNVEGFVVSASELDELTAVLAEFRAKLAASDADTNCDLHNHDDD